MDAIPEKQPAAGAAAAPASRYRSLGAFATKQAELQPDGVTWREVE